MVDKVKEVLNLIIKGRLLVNTLELEECPQQIKYTINIIGTEICLYNKGDLFYLFIDADRIAISNSDFINLQSLFKQIQLMKDHNKSINKLNAIIDACN